MADYIPQSDGLFQAWQSNFVAYAVANAAALGLDPLTDIPPLTDAQTVWDTDYPAHTTAQAAAQSARQAKDAARSSFEGVPRSLVARLQASPDVDDTERQALGITVRDVTPTASAIPTTRPLVTVDTSQRLRHVIRFADELTPTRTAKPDGVMPNRAAPVRKRFLAHVSKRFFGGDPAPVDPSELTFLALDTRTPYTADYTGGDANKTAH